MGIVGIFLPIYLSSCIVAVWIVELNVYNLFCRHVDPSH